MKNIDNNKELNPYYDLFLDKICNIILELLTKDIPVSNEIYNER